MKDFVAITYQCFPEIAQKTEDEQVIVLASAYNRGFWLSIQAIERWIGQKAFLSGKNAAIRFAYTDISNEFFTIEAPKIFETK